MKLALERELAEEGVGFGMMIFDIFVIIFWLKQAYVEVLQARSEGYNYLCSFWNIIDMIGLLFVLAITLLTLLHSQLISVESMRVIAAFGSCCTLIKLIDWLRLFEETAFYVLLVQITLKDITYFMLLVLTTLMMFGVPLLMLDANSAEDKDLIDGVFNFWLLDLIYN